MLTIASFFFCFFSLWTCILPGLDVVGGHDCRTCHLRCLLLAAGVLTDHLA